MLKVYQKSVLVFLNHSFFGQTLKVVAKCCLIEFFHGDLCCCVKRSNVEYQDEIFKTYH